MGLFKVDNFRFHFKILYFVIICRRKKLQKKIIYYLTRENSFLIFTSLQFDKLSYFNNLDVFDGIKYFCVLMRM